MEFMQNWPDGFKTRTVTVIQGNFEVSAKPDVAFSTILGSCISVCLFDPVARMGGMNHYLLAQSSTSDGNSMKYGAHAMELLINRLLRKGAARSELKAKVYGGSRMSERFKNIGSQNIEFARNFLRDEGFPILEEDLGGTSARRINFHPYSGAVRINHTSQPVAVEEETVLRAPRPKKDPAPIVLF